MQKRTLWITGATIAAALIPLASAFAQDAPPAPPGLSAPAPAAGAPTVTLRYKYKTGQVIRYKLSQDMSQTMTGLPNAPTTPINTHTDTIMRMTVLSVRASDGAATIKNSIESINMTMNGKPFDMPAASKSMLMTGTTMTVLPDGKIAPTAQDSKSMSKALGFDPTSMMSPQTGGYLPQGPVKVGDIWKATMEVMKLQMFVQSRLAALSQVNGATMADIKLYMSANGTMTVPTQGMTIKTALKIETKGLTHFNVDSGMMTGMSSDTTTVSTTHLPKMGTATASQAPMSMHSNGNLHMVMEQIPDATP